MNVKEFISKNKDERFSWCYESFQDIFKDFSTTIINRSQEIPYFKKDLNTAMKNLLSLLDYANHHYSVYVKMAREKNTSGASKLPNNLNYLIQQN